MKNENLKRYMEKLNSPGNEHLLEQFKEKHKLYAKRYRLRQLADPELAKKYRAQKAAKARARYARVNGSNVEDDGGAKKQAKVLKTKDKNKETESLKKDFAKYFGETGGKDKS